MKVNAFGMLFNFLAICAVSNFVILSAAGIPLSDEQKPVDATSTSSSLIETSSIANETVATTQSKEKSTVSSENASVEDSKDTLPPLLFPSDDENPSAKNDTALKILQKVSGQSTEEPKSQNVATDINVASSSEKAVTSSPVSTESTLNISVTDSATTEGEDDYDSISEEGEKTDAENIQPEKEEKQEELEEGFARNGSDKATINMFADPMTNEPTLHNGHVALIFSSTLVVLSVVAYIGLILWRSRLESRYGMRQRLVTNDDYYNNNDVRYFGL